MKSKYYCLLVNAYKEHARPVSIREVAGLPTVKETVIDLKRKGHHPYIPAISGMLANRRDACRMALENLVRKGQAKRIKKGNRIFYKPVDMPTTMFSLNFPFQKPEDKIKKEIDGNGKCNICR